MFGLTREPIDTARISRSLQRPEDGALVVFEGIVRDNARDKAVRFLEYEAYESMALKKLEEVGAMARSRALYRPTPCRPCANARFPRRCGLQPGGNAANKRAVAQRSA